MGAQKLSRTRGSADCPFGISIYNTHRIMPKFTNIHWHPEFEVLYIEQGQYELYSPTQLHILSGGNMYLVPPGEDHSIRSLQETGTYWSIAFSLDMVSGNNNHFLQASFIEPLLSGTLLLPRIIDHTEHLFNLILAQAAPLTQLSSDSTAYKLAAHVAANTICAGIAPYCQNNSTQIKGFSRENDAIKTCVQYINSHYSEKITAQSLANLVHLHPNYLCGLFKEQIGASPVEYINMQRIYAANTLLKNTNLSLQQIADRTGFNSVSYFSRVFRQQQGISPGAYSILYQKNQQERD